ncbi:MAG: type II toxin-antitoxin system RelE/ParE family toxin [Flavobacteriales bacterium]|nr:type II toxin-antitoxin system RelE/ParE family toxin [Flavobacteriales bacterium]
MQDKHNFHVKFLSDAARFLDEIDVKAKEKILYNIRKAQMANDRTLFKKLTKEIWEFRTLHKRTYYRLFAFWERAEGKDSLVLATHGLIKKTGKLPKQELNRAERIRTEHLNLKAKRK